MFTFQLMLLHVPVVSTNTQSKTPLTYVPMRCLISSMTMLPRMLNDIQRCESEQDGSHVFEAGDRLHDQLV